MACNQGVPQCIVRHHHDEVGGDHRNVAGEYLTSEGRTLRPGQTLLRDFVPQSGEPVTLCLGQRWFVGRMADPNTETPPGWTRLRLVLDTESQVWFNGGTEGEAPPREKETTMTKIDQVALDVIDALLREDGDFERDPGQVLFGLAEATGHEYKAVSLAVLYLESMGFVDVERRDSPEAHKANRLIRIRLL